MKAFLIISISLAALFIIFQTQMAMAKDKTNEQKYTVLRVEKDFEIRFYPSATLATITSSAKSYKELANPGFRKLANYIFGGNKDKQKISMTSPVHMDINDSASSMSFVMPANYNKDNLPIPNNPDVIIKTTSDEYVALIKFGGFASDKKIKIYAEKLEKALEEKSISFYGHFRFLGYNPPFQLFCRRNEIIVSVHWVSK
jgi:hypothetical protein